MPVTILRGVSGSGKSTYAKSVPGVVCSADDFFMVRGVYRFDPLRLGEAHAACLRKFVSLVTRRTSVVVDNTNIRVLEMAPYVAVALAYGARVKIVTVICDPLVAASRNQHGVSGDAVLRQYSRLMEEEIPPQWLHVEMATHISGKLPEVNEMLRWEYRKTYT